MSAEIELCPAGSAPQLMKFLDENWQRGHVLSRSRELLDWQHFDAGAGYYNYLLAKGKDGQIEAVLGFIPTDRYDSVIAGDCVVWLSLWKTRENSGNPMLGLLLLKSLEVRRDWKAIGTLGVSDVAAKIYRLLKYKTGFMNHYYIANPDLDKFRIAVLPEKKILKLQDGITLREITGKIPDVEIESGHIPAKTREFIINRYINHPFYNYSAYLAESAGQKLVMIIREIEVNGATVLRVIDCIGNIELLAKAAGHLQELVVVNDAEYVDLMVAGEGVKAEIGECWSELDHGSGEVIIPNYFEPFVQENVKVGYAFKLLDSEETRPFLLFRGDADQDRPNFL